MNGVLGTNADVNPVDLLTGSDNLIHLGSRFDGTEIRNSGLSNVIITA